MGLLGFCFGLVSSALAGAPNTGGGGGAAGPLAFWRGGGGGGVGGAATTGGGGGGGAALVSGFDSSEIWVVISFSIWTVSLAKF